MNTLPLVFYKTSLLWVDDDELLLQAASDQYGRSYNIKIFDNPNVCLDFFQQYQSLLSKQFFLRGYKELDDYDSINHMPIDFNIQALAHLHTNPNRHNEISVMVVDYQMPNLNGLTLCERINSFPIKKILLTGEVDDNEAVKGFNEGIINRFLRKDDLMLPEKLDLYFKALTKQYFCEQTAALLSYLEVDRKLPLTDPVFIHFFDKWCSTHNICEYYLIDKNGSFLTINERKEIKYFIVHTDASLDFFTSMNDDEDGVVYFTDAVKKREKIPFFGINKEPWRFKPQEWSPFFYSPQIIVGREKYYWSIVYPL